jgi:putative endonuclease
MRGVAQLGLKRPLGKAAVMNGSGENLYYVYILQSCKNNKLYIGQTNNIERRIEDHNSGLGGKYTRQNSPWILVHSEQHPNRVSAVRRERFLKSTRGSLEKKRLAGITGQTCE